MSYINRDNYESFFLLYTDNELSVAEKKLVDEFIHSNPDLQEELVMLQQSRLRPDEITFGDKSMLFKTEALPESVQADLLCLLDDEIIESRRLEIKALIQADVAVAKEWGLIQQTKFQPEKIIFEDKASLYRKEAGRVVAFPFRKIAAAAVLIGFGLWGGWMLFKDNTTNTPGNIAGKTQPAAVESKTGLPVEPPRKSSASPQSDVESPAALTAGVVKEKSPMPGKLSPVQKITNRTAVNELTEVETVSRKDNQLPKPYFENVNNQPGNKLIAANVTPETQPTTIVNAGNNVNEANEGSQDAANSYAAATSFTDNSENNNRILYFEEEKLKKTKIGGIFRKVKRVLERGSNLNTGGHNIKVANLEFTIQ